MWKKRELDLVRSSSGSRIRLREFSKLKYGDPRGFLTVLGKFREKNAIALRNTPREIRNLRTNALKAERERLDAALFCLGMSQCTGCEVRFALVEEQDFDFVATWQTTDPGPIQHYCPVQLKEVVPEHLNTNTSLQEVVSKLDKYVDSDDLIVAIKYNRVTHFSPTALQVPAGLKLGGLWVFGSTSEDQTEWAIWGDFCKKSRPVAGLRYRSPMP